MTRALGAALVLVALCTAPGCLVPRGQPVVLDSRSGSWWTGDGVLLERSGDGERCHVAARSRAGVVEKRWVPCRYVHERSRPR